MLMSTRSPEAMGESAHWKSVPTGAGQLSPRVVVADAKVTLTGKLSVTMMPLAVTAPRFRTCSVYVSGMPGTRNCADEDLLIHRSGVLTASGGRTVANAAPLTLQSPAICCGSAEGQLRPLAEYVHSRYSMPPVEPFPK